MDSGHMLAAMGELGPIRLGAVVEGHARATGSGTFPTLIDQSGYTPG